MRDPERELCHRVRVFVYRYHEGAPDYLLLRGANLESFWTPIHGPIGFGEKLESAIRREVMHDIGITRPSRLIDLEMPARWQLGDEQTIEWVFGFHAQPSDDRLVVDKYRWADFRWAQFAEAYPSLELDHDRAAIMRLHTMLHAA
jgi:NADH pyrophosphatase NudC (nudix superfamily)